MQKVPLTLIIPIYDRPEALNRALRSVDGQDSAPEEVIVVDDGSPVPSAIDPDLARRLNVRLIRHEGNRGPAAARNTGMREARTDWITFLDSDDYLLRGGIAERWEDVRERLRQGAPETTIFGCGWIDFTANHEASPLALALSRRHAARIRIRMLVLARLMRDLERAQSRCRRGLPG